MIQDIMQEQKRTGITQGHETMNETRTITLKYRHGNAVSDPNSKILGNNASFNLPTLLQSQARIKAPLKAPPKSKKDVTVEVATPFTIMSYKPEKNDVVAKTSLKGQPLNKKGRALKNVVGAIPRWKAKPTTLRSPSDYPDPLLKASKSFLTRISELSQLETETVKYEKTVKLKKKKQTDVS